jgi:hypothetical protein
VEEDIDEEHTLQYIAQDPTETGTWRLISGRLFESLQKDQLNFQVPSSIPYSQVTTGSFPM